MKLTKEESRAKRKLRIRKKIRGVAERPRLVVFRSNLHMYAQIVDDATGAVLTASSTLSLNKKAGQTLKPNKAGAVEVGKDVAKRALEKGISQVVFDRNGFQYHGCVKALADGAREGGLAF